MKKTIIIIFKTSNNRLISLKSVYPTSDSYIVTGEKRSGKTCATYAIGKSASRKAKVLLIDLDVRNLGPSSLAENVGDPSTVLFET